MHREDDEASSPNRRSFLKAVPFLTGAPAILTAASAEAARPGRAADAPLEDDEALKQLLAVVPRPIVPARPELVEMYDTCWGIGLQKTQFGTPENGFVRWYIDAAFDNRIFQWDTAFSMAWAKYGQGALPGIESLDNFYRKQHDDGAIAGVIRKKDGTDDQPKDAPWFTRNNLFSWAEWEHYQTTGNDARFERVVPILRDYVHWLVANRRHENGHFFWSGWASGMDNSPRSRADKFYPPYSWVDNDANEALAAHYLAKMADHVGDDETAEEMRALHAELKALVNEEMWSEEDRFYWDLDRDGSFLKHKTIASFWPMWGRITEPHHVDGLIAHLEDPESFNRPHRVPTLAADHPDYDPEGGYWRGAVWAPTNHMVTKGLAAQGRHREAREIVLNHLDNMAEVFAETGTVWENYAPETAAPGDPAKGDFVGWSADGPIAQLIEHYIGIVPDVPANEVRWTLLTTEEVGLDNLKLGDKTVDLKVSERRRKTDPVELRVHTPAPLTVRLTTDGETWHEVDVIAGEQVVMVG